MMNDYNYNAGLADRRVSKPGNGDRKTKTAVVLEEGHDLSRLIRLQAGHYCL